MHLRNDIKWSDNVPLTAEDFIFTWQMAVSPQNTVATTYPYDMITVEAPDPQTVVVTVSNAVCSLDGNFVAWHHAGPHT